MGVVPPSCDTVEGLPVVASEREWHSPERGRLQ